MAEDRSLKFLLDTNVISELRKGDQGNPVFVRWADALSIDEAATSVMVVAEIRRGIEMIRPKDSRRAAKLEEWVAQLRQQFEGRIFPVDENVAVSWALLNVPQQLPVIDGLLAATAIVYGLRLVTRNTRDFAKTGVTLVNPFEH